MRIPRFYCPDLVSSQQQLDLPDSVHRHAVQVLRLKPGERIRLFDGRGLEHEATLTLVEKGNPGLKSASNWLSRASRR